MEELVIFLQNVRGMQDYKKRRKIFHHLHLKPQKVFFLQETHLCKTEWGGKIYFAHGTSNSWGVAILLKKTNIKVHKVLKNLDGRYLIMDTTFGTCRVLLANIYAPNADSPHFFMKLVEDLEDFTVDQKIIGGTLILY